VAHLFPSMDSCMDFPLLVLYVYNLFLYFIFPVVQNKDGTVAVASAFAGHKQGIVCEHFSFIFQFHSFIHYDIMTK